MEVAPREDNDSVYILRSASAPPDQDDNVLEDAESQNQTEDVENGSEQFLADDEYLRDEVEQPEEESKYQIESVELQIY